MMLTSALSALPAEEVPEGAVVVLVEGCVDEGVEERVGVSEPEEDTLPDRRNVAGAQRDDELGQEERDPAEHEDANQDSHHQCGSPLLLLAPRLALGLKRHGCMADAERHLGLFCRLLHLRTKDTEIYIKLPSQD